MSDLQCAARFVVLAEPAVVEGLGGEGIAAVYDARSGPHVEGPEDLLGLPVQETQPLTDVDVLRRERRALDVLCGLADLHRGETVVVLADGAPGRRLAVSVDADGVVVRSLDPEAAP